MTKSLIAITLIAFSWTVSAEDMSRTERYQDVNVGQPDGNSLYRGKCSTHEDYKGIHFRRRVLTRQFDPHDMTEAQVTRRLAKYDTKVIELLLRTFEIDDLEDEPKSIAYTIVNYVDDLEIEKINHKLYPNMDLLRFNMGVGGGNGGYLVVRRTVRNGRTSYKKMSYTFDGDLMYCDRQVWMN